MTRREILFGAVALPVIAQGSANNRFNVLANDYIEHFLRVNPEAATDLGDHRQDDRLSDRSATAVQEEVRKQREYLKKLDAIRESELDQTSRIDARVLRNQIESSIWEATVLREDEWNPMSYNPGDAIYLLLERSFAPLPKRLESARSRLQQVPLFLRTAKANLKTSTHIHCETAIAQTGGTINLFTAVLDEFVKQAPEIRDSLQPAQRAAVEALKDWRDWLGKEVLPNANKDVRLGPELYKTKLRLTLDSDLSSDEIRRRAERDVKQIQAQMLESARKLGGGEGDPRQVIRAVLDKLAESRPHAETIVAQARKELADTTAFVRDHRLVSIYETPIKVIDMPEFQRGVAVANCEPPGPLEKNGITFFNIAPPPSDWSPAQVESYFREYNNSMLKELTVHEAMPGHYLQFGHSNRFHAPTPTRAVFWSGTFVEGWAVYAECVMAEAGYGGPEVRMQQLKMRLRATMNAIIDQGVHAQGMTEQQAMDLMVNEGFQEKSEATGKWRRASLTSAQLSTYYVGASELDQLREDYARKYGPIRDLMAFHDKMLSFGSPAPRYLRELMGV